MNVAEISCLCTPIQPSGIHNHSKVRGVRTRLNRVDHEIQQLEIVKLGSERLDCRALVLGAQLRALSKALATSGSLVHHVATLALVHRVAVVFV
ncbi:MAG: hypothetical protein AAGI01_05430 [Myxococcota bacterium]